MEDHLRGPPQERRVLTGTGTAQGQYAVGAPAGLRPAPAAVLFDMDGLLVDSEPLWTVAEQELVAGLGGTWSAQLKAAIVGTRLDEAVAIILRWYDAPCSPPDVSRAAGRLLTRMAELFATELPLMPGVTDLLRGLDRGGIPCALVSSSFRVLVDAVLAGGIGPFAVTVAGDEVRRGKPDPEPYLQAASALGVAPDSCVVVEDSPAGVRSGLAAGCAVLAVPSVAGVSFPDAPRLQVVDSLRGVGVRQLAALVDPDR